MQNAAEALGRVQMHPLAGHDEREGIPAQGSQQNAHRTTLNETSMPEASHDGNGPCVPFVECDEHRGRQDRDPIQDHPQRDHAARTVRGTYRRPFRPWLGGRHIGSNSLPKT